MDKLVQAYPHNPWVLSRMGRLCLETGRKQQAVEHFNQVQRMMKDSSSPHNANGLDNLLGTEGGDDYDQELSVLCSLNK